MNVENIPDPEFVNNLEWELKSALRRQGELNGTSRTRRLVGLRLGTTLALVAVSMLVGGAGTHAVTHRADKKAAKLYIARGEALLEIAETRLAHAGRELAGMQQRHEQGAVTDQELQQVETHFVHVESEVDVRKLDLAETRITGKEPNDALSAPLVDGQDFVTERMAARRRPIQMRLQLVSDQVQRYQQLSAAGRVSARELKAVEMTIAGVEEEQKGLEQRIELRASFLAGELSAAEVELQGMRLAAVAAREMAVRQVEVLAMEHERLKQMHERGMVSDSELNAVQTELHTIKAHMELADLELRIIDEKLKDAQED
ncbi:MAG: hypothetical protein ABIG44_16055 [Planctomycetota bacterium]